MLQIEVPNLGHRESPRPRHEVSPRVVSVLRPFIRYSDWREGWILRLVGERYGPVLKEALPAGRAEGAPRRSERLPQRPTAVRFPTLLLTGAIALAAVLGFLIARSTSGGGSTGTLGKPVRAGALEVALPEGWQVRPAQELARLGLSNGVAAVSGDRQITVGMAATSDSSLLPPGILASAQQTPTAELVTLRGTTFDRYSRLSLRGQRGSESVYAVPTSSGTLLAVCWTLRADAAFASTCQRVVQSIELRSGSLAPGLVPTYAEALTAVIDRLDAARARWSAQLSSARTAQLQATAASQLAAAHAQAASELTGLSPGPARAGNAALVAALRMNTAAYGALSRAAINRRSGDYQAAIAALGDAHDALSSAVERLQSFGYRFG